MGSRGNRLLCSDVLPWVVSYCDCILTVDVRWIITIHRNILLCNLSGRLFHKILPFGIAETWKIRCLCQTTQREATPARLEWIFSLFGHLHPWIKSDQIYIFHLNLRQKRWLYSNCCHYFWNRGKIAFKETFMNKFYNRVETQPSGDEGLVMNFSI